MPIRNAPSAVPTTLRFIGSRLAHRLRGPTAGPRVDFRARVERALATLGDAVLRCDWLSVDADTPPWRDTGLSLADGRAITLMADGVIQASPALDVAFAAKVGLWFRIGDGELAKIIGDACTLYVENGGSLRFTAKPPGEFADRHGAFEAGIPRGGMRGGFEVAVIQWRDDPVPALEAAAKHDAALFGPALKRLRAPVRPPPGWHYLWRLGDGEIFAAAPHRDGELVCCTQADVGILQFPVDRPLTDASRIGWSWCVEQLPSKLPEHIEPTHDYLSMAVEFDNGLDLTWMWSAALPIDTIFQCPLAWWKDRETHWVVRSGSEQLGLWLDERRSLAGDYRKAIGGPLPSRITGVWLIANSVFQRGEGRCRYRDIVLEDDEGSWPIRS